MPTIFKILAKWQADPLMCDESGRLHPALTVDALLLALHNQRPDVVSLLLAASFIGNLPIKEAIKIGSITNFEAFLWHGWDIDEPVELDGPSALGYAVQDRELVKGLLRLGADPNGGSQYDTALSRAVLVGSMDVIKMLLLKGGDVKRGQLLHWALEREHDAYEVVTLLLERGAMPNSLEFDGILPIWSVQQKLGTPLHKAVTLNKLDIASQLLRYGADPGKEDTSGKTAMQLADDLGNREAASLFRR
ncbi:Ankyrin repeat protein [Teratosphaeria destructans]|uniref:Ankyrin repeat protein n=1 Tax=Teratosphaeria destructans TaxID=418781 RepID=A0A9W7SK30_9PEZI|nr:Ankyrin repeat protein [Teratosphaeria destructans]